MTISQIKESEKETPKSFSKVLATGLGALLTAPLGYELYKSQKMQGEDLAHYANISAIADSVHTQRFSINESSGLPEVNNLDEAKAAYIKKMLSNIKPHFRTKAVNEAVENLSKENTPKVEKTKANEMLYNAVEKSKTSFVGRHPVVTIGSAAAIGAALMLGAAYIGNKRRQKKSHAERLEAERQMQSVNETSNVPSR